LRIPKRKCICLFIYLFREEGGEHGPVKKRETKLM
jgi:hypothetical protein